MKASNTNTQHPTPEGFKSVLADADINCDRNKRNEPLPMFYKKTKDVITFAHDKEVTVGQTLDIPYTSNFFRVSEIIEKRKAAGDWELNEYNGKKPEKMKRPNFYKVKVEVIDRPKILVPIEPGK